MNNRKIRKSNKKSGTFTTVDYNILRDKNLNCNAKILLIEILSDSDNFDLSQTLYCARLGWAKNQFTRAIEQLIEYGYMKRTPIEKDKVIPGKKKKGSNRILYFYTVSEYGNLNNEKVPEVSGKNNSVAPPSEEEIMQFNKRIHSDDFLNVAFTTLDDKWKANHIADREVFKTLITKLESEKEELQKLYIESVIQNLKDFESVKYPDSIKKKMRDHINVVVFQENRSFNPSSVAGANDESQSHWQHLKSNFNKRQNGKRIDQETSALND
jgi:hypothetical protein